LDGNTYTVASSSIAATTFSYTITGLAIGTDYFVRVAAMNSNDYGAYGYLWSTLYSTGTNVLNGSGMITYNPGFGLASTGGQVSNTLAAANFSRVRYEYTLSSGVEFARVDFNRFPSNTTTAGANSPSTSAAATIANLAIPDRVNPFAIKSNVTDMTIYSSDVTLNTSGATGHLEIWPYAYGKEKNTNYTFGSETTYDANDSIDNRGYYGSFQVFNTSPVTPKTVFAWNNHGAVAPTYPDFGIGTASCASGNPDWTGCGDPNAKRSGFQLAVKINVPVKTFAQNAICFNGTNQYLELTTNSNLPIGNDAYTIEAFVKSSTSNTGGIAAWGTYEQPGKSNAFAMGTPNGYRNYHWQSDLNANSRNNAFNGNWHHVVAQFDGTTQRLYEDGYLIATNTATNNVTGTANLTIGRAYNAEYLNGCLSNLRIVKGVAVYSGTSTTVANFTVPVNDLTATQSASTNISAITGTQTALLMNNRTNILQDASTWGYTLTANNSPTISSSGPSLSPLGPTISYAATTVIPNASVSATPVSTGSTVTAYSVSSGTPLSGTLNLNTTTGVISGTAPAAFGTYTYTINAIDGTSISSSTNFVLQVSKLTPTLTTIFATPPSSGVANTITASSSVPGQISFQNNSGSISGCINRNTTGSGPYTATCAWTPATGSYSITAAITPSDLDSYNATASTAVTGTIAGPGSLAVTSNSNTLSNCGYGNNALGLTLPDSKRVANNSEYTIEAWVKIDPTTNPGRQCAQLSFDNNNLFGATDSWNQRTGDNAADWGSYYMSTNGNLISRCGVTESSAKADCKNVEMTAGTWTHIVLQKSTTLMTVYIGGKQVVSRSVAGLTSTNLMKYIKIGPFGSNNSGTVFFGQMRVSSGALYPTGSSGNQIFAPTYDFSSTVSGGTVLALFKPQTNSTLTNLQDLSGNGTTVAVQLSNVTAASTDYASPPAPAFSYSPASVSTFTGSVLASASPVLTGGDINSYSVNPALPIGVNLNATTGVISGTPTLSSPTTTYVVTGTQASSGLQTTANVTITVNKPATTISLQLANSAVQVGVVNTITATTSTVGNVSFQTGQGVIPGCSSVATTTVSPFTATCPWVPTSSYFTMNATLTPTNSELATTTSNPALTNIRGSLRLTSTGRTTYPGESLYLATNNTLRLNFPQGTGLATSQSFTIETWVKVNNPVLNIDLSAFYGNSFYGDRGNGIAIFGSDTRIIGFLSASAIGTTSPATPFVSNNTWQNVVFQRKVVPGNPSEGYDAVFINGVLVAQFGTGGYSQGDPAMQEKSTGVRIGPFNGVTQIGPTQVLSGVAAYPLTGFSPATTYSFGANTLALFQPSPTSCGSAAMAPQTVTATNGESTVACSAEYPVAPPSITSVVANSGPIAGLNTVVISGTNFIDLVANGLKFGTTAIPLADYSINTFGTQITAKVPSGALGTLDVTVQTAGGTSAISAGSKYSYVAAPTITSLSPSVGAEAGGIGVVITGTGFTNVSAVTFGSSNATSFTVNSSTQITANFPAGLGSTYVKVTTPGGTSAENASSAFTYTSATSVNSISPATGSTSGGTVVEISGTNFSSSSTVVFGANAATNVSYNSTTGRLTATSPAGVAGTVNVRVTTAGSQSATATANQFVYTAAVAVSAISVAVGPTTGGTVVEISGTNFSSSSTVVFGANAATNVSYNSTTGRLTATSPAGTGMVNVRVTTSGTQSATATANQFTYYAPPTITGLSRSTGPNGGGSSVIITGTNFTSLSTVAFGTNNVTTFAINSLTQITANSPTGTGAVDVRIANEGGTSADTVADNFTYFPLPAVTTISPTTGTTAGGTSVTITGQNFIGATAVKFGITDATTFTVVSDTQITATAPAGTGEVNVTVITPGGTSAVALYGKFTYVSPPTISSISPSSGMLTGGQDVIITGTGLSNLLVTGGVLFGTIAAQTVTIIDSTQIRVVTPATTMLGVIDIFAVNSSGSSTASAASKFTYTKSNDAKLSALVLSQGTLVGVFSPTANTYTSSVINSVDKVTVTPTVNQANATVQVTVGSGAFGTVTSGSASLDLPLVVGANTILVKVTAHDETTTNTYTITLTRLSNIATLFSAAIKAQTATLGTPNAVLASVIAGEITLTTAQAAGIAATTFTKTDAGATINRIVKYASGAPTSNFEIDTAFINSATDTVANGDFFIIKVTAQDGTVNYSRFNVTVNSNIARLSAGSIKGQSATIGTAGLTLGSLAPGSITLTTAQATGVGTTTFTKTDAGATITKIAKLASSAVENSTNFNAATALSNGSTDTVSNGDYFIIKITAADATVNYYRFDVTVNSNVATLSGVSIKGLNSTLGTPGAVIASASVTPGAITLTTAQATGTATTTFTKTDSNATISRIVKYASGAPTANFDTDTTFTNSATDTVANGDFFIVKVTAVDGTVNHYRINVTVNSDVATLTIASIKGQSATIGTAGSTLGSLSAGTVTLTTAQSAGANTTTFTKSDAGATITKIAKLASSTVENSTNFNAAAAFTNGATSPITNGDYFIVQVTAADATVKYTRFDVTINSNIATLSTATIKGLSATVGTPGVALGSLTPGTITLTVSQATGSAATTFTKSDAGATVTKIAKLASSTVENSTNFSAAAAFTNGSTDSVSNGDFFIIQVTAADGTVNYYRFNLVFATNPSEPLSLSATAQGGGANLTWSAPTGNGGSALTGYVIEASTDSTTWTSVGTTNQSTTQFSVTNLLNGTSYSYRVRAANSSGDLNPFNWATSAAVRSFYFVECSTSGSFYVSSVNSPVTIPSAAGVNCKGVATIPSGIQKVASNAFSPNPDTDNKYVTGINFPSSGLVTIDQGAFKRLGLTSVTIPASVQTVGLSAFARNSLSSVFITGTSTGPSTFLADGAFSDNNSLALTLGSGQIEIGQNFGVQTSFSSIDWGTGLKGIGDNAFRNISGGTWVPLFPSAITSFGSGAFQNAAFTSIRFGSATVSKVTFISETAFDTSITSIQYCGSSGTVLSNYINSRFTTKTIWCSEEVPNAPINLTAVAGTSGQVVLNWGKGATRAGVEAPTYRFEVRYSSDGGSTWSALIQAAATATSITVPNLVNGTSYKFQIRAKNLMGESDYSTDAIATPLGDRNNPQFGPTTSTAVGFTVNIINYDATYTYSVPQVTQGSGTVSVGTAIGNTLPITVIGMSPGSVATISIGNQKSGFTSGSGLTSGSALNAAKVPVIGNIVTLTGGFTAVVTNYDSTYLWSVSSTLGTAVINTQGGITVSGVNPSTAVELTVSTTRVGYAPGSSKTTVTTLALLRVFYNGTRSTGGAAPTDANSYASNASAVVLANPATGGLTLNGYDFSGWSLNSDESGQLLQPSASLQLGLVNVTLYAKWTLKPYTVTYNANGATGGSVPLDSNTYTMGGSVPILGNTGTLVRTGYSFIGWGLSSTDTVNQYVSGNTYTVGTNNIAFWARWSPNTYKVTFDANGGTGSPSKAEDNYTTAGTAVPLATRGTLEKTGYNFAGWGLAAVSTAVADPFTTTSNVELYAQWTVANFAVTYFVGTYGSGTVPTQANVNYGTSFTVAAATGLTGSDGTNPYSFVSWSDGTRTYAPGQSILMGAGAVTLTAQWTRVYNVKYSFNGGSVGTPIADQQKIAGDTIVISSTVPTRAGYDFVTWKDQSGEEATAGANYVVRDSHYLLYAQWTAKSYTITYDVNGGNSTVPTQANRTIGQIFSVAAAPSKVGYDFEHWSDGTRNYNPGADYQVGISNVILQAIWTPQVYQISYNFNGGTGTPIAAQNYTYGTGPATLPASGPTRFEFNFLGWATTPTATSPVSASFAPSGNIMMHAVWVTSVYRLTFNAGIGVSDSSTATVTIGQSTLLPGATRTNYTLQGWSISETGGTLLPLSSPYTPIADAILYAQWVAQVFTVTYNGNGGTAARPTDAVSYNVPTPIVLPSASRTNYVFNGWYSQATGGYLLGEASANYSPTASITAYARWVQGSLSGMGPATLIAQLTVRDGINTGFTAGSNGSTATVAYTAGALPDGTVITAYLEDSTNRVTSLLQTAATPILSLIIAWVAPDGAVPDTHPAKPIVMTVTNSSITAGSKVYGLVGNQPELLGVAQIDGQVQVSIYKDPAVVVAMVAPDAPTGVTATAIDSTSATISWTAPVGNGGSAITGYTARSNATQTCTTTSATSCVMTGLVTGTAYTFTVVATNGIGTGAASSASAPLTLSAPTPPPAAPVSPPSVPSSSSTSSSEIAAAQAAIDAKAAAEKKALEYALAATKAAAEKAAADAKAAAELKAAQDRAAAEAAVAAALKAAKELSDAQAKAAAELKAAQDKATEDARIAAELKAAQEKADADLKAAAEKKALEDAAAAAALAAKKIVPKISLYSISSKLILSAYDTAYLKKYISTLKSKAVVTCIGYYYTKNTTLAKAKALATSQATAVCKMIKKAKSTVITKVVLYPSTQAPKAAQGAKWVAISYRVDSFKGK
jgi:uncharacterized repeat protein (TIGR02543 family)